MVIGIGAGKVDNVVEKGSVVFTCPNCKNSLCEDDTIDKLYLRVQSSDQVYDNEDVKRLIESWYCSWCGHYFRVYYKLEKLTVLREEEVE